MNSSKRQTNGFVLTTRRPVFVCFLEEIEDTKKPFEITWPLKEQNFPLNKFLNPTKSCFKHQTLFRENFSLKIGTHLRGIKLLPGNRLSWVAHMCDPIQSVPIDFPSEYRKFWRFFYIFWNPTICNIIRWFAGPMGQITRRPSVWLSKHFFFFFHNFL